eukprot:7385040-Prymnesium_polylepis.2
MSLHFQSIGLVGTASLNQGSGAVIRRGSGARHVAPQCTDTHIAVTFVNAVRLAMDVNVQPSVSRRASRERFHGRDPLVV